MLYIDLLIKRKSEKMTTHAMMTRSKSRAEAAAAAAQDSDDDESLYDCPNCGNQSSDCDECPHCDYAPRFDNEDSDDCCSECNTECKEEHDDDAFECPHCDRVLKGVCMNDYRTLHVYHEEDCAANGDTGDLNCDCANEDCHVCEENCATYDICMWCEGDICAGCNNKMYGDICNGCLRCAPCCCNCGASDDE